MTNKLQIHTPGRPHPIFYPPPQDVRYGELVRLRNCARKLGLADALADLQWRLDRHLNRVGAAGAATAQLELLA